jgi:hypothetical protein
MRIVFVLTIALCAPSFGALAQQKPYSGVNNTVYNMYLKPVSEGYFTFKDLPPNMQQTRSAHSLLLCQEMSNAISFGKRLALGLSPDAAVADIRFNLNGKSVCAWGQSGRPLTSRAIAVRGDDSGRRIVVMQWTDNAGGIYYTGVPLSMIPSVAGDDD